MFSKALGSWLYQIGAFATVLITWALILVRPAASGFTLHKILCLCLVRTLNGAVRGIQVPLHLTWDLIPVKPGAFTLHKTLCLHQVRISKRAVLGIQVPLHLT